MLADKISITLPAHLNKFASEYQASHHLKSKSEVVALGLKILEAQHLEACYREMVSELGAEDSSVWEGTVGDGLEPEDW